MRDWLNEGADPDDTDEMTDEEMVEEVAFRARWQTVLEDWRAAGKKCRCGQAISLEEAYYVGACHACLIAIQPFGK